jgi:hypothetical protein
VQNFVIQCETCQLTKHERVHPTGLLQPLPILAGAWQDISLDFIEGLPNSEGFTAILVVVDRFSKYPHFVALKHTFTVQHVAKVILDTVVRLQCMPKSMVSDRDMIFMSHFWKELFRLNSTTFLTSNAYHQ